MLAAPNARYKIECVALNAGLGQAKWGQLTFKFRSFSFQLTVIDTCHMDPCSEAASQSAAAFWVSILQSILGQLECSSS